MFARVTAAAGLVSEAIALGRQIAAQLHLPVDRVETTKTPKQLENEINQSRRLLEQQERSQGSPEQVQRELDQEVKTYRERKRHIRVLKQTNAVLSERSADSPGAR